MGKIYKILGKEKDHLGREDMITDIPIIAIIAPTISYLPGLKLSNLHAILTT